MKTVEILAFQECMATPAFTSYEVLQKINGLWKERHGKTAGDILRVRLVACGTDRTVRSSCDLPVRCHAVLADVGRTDLIIVPAFDGDVLKQLEINKAVVPWLRTQYRKGADIAAICTGAFALAEAGLLEGRAATTHWAAQDLFRRRYPGVHLQPHQIIVDEGRLCTSGGAFSFLNLLLYLAEKHVDQETALLASRIFLIDMNKSPQGAYAILSPQKTHDDPAILRTQLLIEKDLTEELTLDRLAAGAALSRRQFQRRFRTATGNTPVEYIQRVRIEAAKKALASTRDRLDEIASAVGYEDAPGFRKLFIRYTGLTPSEFRKKYHPAYAPLIAPPVRRPARRAQPGN